MGLHQVRQRAGILRRLAHRQGLKDRTMVPTQHNPTLSDGHLQLGRAKIQAILNMAKAMNLGTLAEGVENEEMA